MKLYDLQTDISHIMLWKPGARPPLQRFKEDAEIKEAVLKNGVRQSVVSLFRQ